MTEAMTPSETNPTPQPPQKGKPVVVYIILMFVIAVLLIVLSYFMHNRSNQQAILAMENSVRHLESIATLQDENIALQEECLALQKENEALHEQIDALHEQIALLTPAETPPTEETDTSVSETPPTP